MGILVFSLLWGNAGFISSTVAVQGFGAVLCLLEIQKDFQGTLDPHFRKSC